eukprot:48696-Rhodomonas_salina.1
MSISQSDPFYQCDSSAAPPTPNVITIEISSVGKIEHPNINEGDAFAITITGLAGVGQSGEL